MERVDSLTFRNGGPCFERRGSCLGWSAKGGQAPSLRCGASPRFAPGILSVVLNAFCIGLRFGRRRPPLRRCLAHGFSHRRGLFDKEFAVQAHRSSSGIHALAAPCRPGSATAEYGDGGPMTPRVGLRALRYGLRTARPPKTAAPPLRPSRGVIRVGAFFSSFILHPSDFSFSPPRFLGLRSGVPSGHRAGSKRRPSMSAVPSAFWFFFFPVHTPCCRFPCSLRLAATAARAAAVRTALRCPVPRYRGH